MSTPLTSPRFFNPLMLWADITLKVQEMLLSSSTVIQARTGRLVKAGLSPSAEDLAEFQLMGHEKLAAATASGVAIANQLHTTHFALVNRASQQWIGGTTALLSLTTSTSPAQAALHAEAFGGVLTRSAATMSQLSSASARVVQRGLKPIHAKATSNARRLASLPN